MNKTTKILKSIEAKEKGIKEALDNATVGDISKEGKAEMIKEVESMINKLEDWKTDLQKDKSIKKAS